LETDRNQYEYKYAKYWDQKRPPGQLNVIGEIGKPPIHKEISDWKGYADPDQKELEKWFVQLNKEQLYRSP
jgi:hypothetical protein